MGQDVVNKKIGRKEKKAVILMNMVNWSIWLKGIKVVNCKSNSKSQKFHQTVELIDNPW